MPMNDVGADGQAGKGRFKLILLIAIGVLFAVALSVAGTWYVLNNMTQDGATEQASTEQAIGKQPAVYQDLQPAFVVNYNVQGRARYLQVSMALMGRDAAAMERLKVHLPMLRNRVVMLLADQDFATLLTPLGKEMLLQQVLASVQELSQKETGSVAVDQVLFTNFVLQ